MLPSANLFVRCTIIGALLFALAFDPARSALEAQTRTPLTVIAFPAADALPFFYAQQNGLFERAGLDVTVQMVGSGAAAISAIVGGAGQIGFANVLSLSVARQKGVPLELVAAGAVYDSSAPNAAALVLNDSTIRAPKDLEDRTVAVPGLHDLNFLSIAAWMDRNGVDSTKVHFVEMPGSTMVAALQAKRVDAIQIYEPFVTEALASGARILGRPSSAISPRYVTGVWYGQTDWIAQHRDVALRFANVMSASATYCNAHYAELIPFIASYTKLPPEMLAKITRMTYSPSLRPPLIQPVIDAAARYHELPSAFAAQDFILAGVP